MPPVGSLIVQIKVKHLRLALVNVLMLRGIRLLGNERLSRLGEKVTTLFLVRWCISERLIGP